MASLLVSLLWFSQCVSLLSVATMSFGYPSVSGSCHPVLQGLCL